MKKKLIITIIVVSCCLLATIGFVIFELISFNSNNKQYKDVTRDITVTLDSVLNRSQSKKVYMWGMVSQLSSETVFSDSELGKKASSLIKYEIKEIDIEAKKVTISFVSPDFYNILKEIAGEYTSVVEPEEIEKRLAEKLDGQYLKYKSTAVCNISKIGEHWYIEPNEEFLNGLTGNIYSYYSSLGIETIEHLLGENDND